MRTLTTQHINILRAGYDQVNRMDPESKACQDLTNVLDQMDNEDLVALATAVPKINFVTIMARLQCFKRKIALPRSVS